MRTMEIDNGILEYVQEFYDNYEFSVMLFVISILMTAIMCTCYMLPKEISSMLVSG